VTFAAGLATQGAIPVVAIYSTFLQRAFDQLIHDVALQHLHVVFALDRGGLVGADGPTHHGVFDLSYLRLIPGMVVMAPKDESELRDMLYTAVEYRGGPIALRYPRGNGVGVPLKEDFDLVPLGRGETIRDGNDVALLGIGTIVNAASTASELLAARGVSAEVVSMRFVKPLDEDILGDIASRFSRVVTLEDNTVIGGFGSAVTEFFSGREGNIPHVLRIGIPDCFVQHGTQQELHASLGMDAAGIAANVARFVAEHQEKAS